MNQDLDLLALLDELREILGDDVEAVPLDEIDLPGSGYLH